MRSTPVAAIAAIFLACPAWAQDSAPPIEVHAAYSLDLVATAAEGEDPRAQYLDNLNVTVDADLAALIGWTGATAHIDLLSNLGDMPNEIAGTLQGVDNIEVGSHRLRLFEAWVEQRIGESMSARFGLYDLNSEFYANDAADLLIAPAFGVGSEIAATGPNGPSIFPSTALAVRIDRRLGKSGVVRAAVLNAAARTLGDPGGVDLSFGQGALLIAEGGIEGEGVKLMIGAWGYTRRHDDISARDALGGPVPRRARGAYLLAEHPLGDPEGIGATAAFVRLGLSDGRTTPFQGGWQAGLRVTRLWEARPESQLALGVQQGYLSSGFRALLRADGIDAAPAESAIELTYSDKLTPWLTVQPDLQLVLDAGGDRSRGPLVFGGLRITIEI